MMKNLLMVLALIFVVSDGAFACCALCNVSLWDLLKILVFPFFLWLVPFVLFIQGLNIFFVEKSRLALLRMLPFLIYMVWIFFDTNN